MRHELSFGHRGDSYAYGSERHLAMSDVGTFVDLHVAAQVDPRFPAVIGHRFEILLEDVEVDHNTRGREILFVKVLEIAEDDLGFDFVRAVGVAAERPRGGGERSAGGS